MVALGKGGVATCSVPSIIGRTYLTLAAPFFMLRAEDSIANDDS